MGLFRWIFSRFSWLARRLWIIAAADVALTSYRHWRRLEPPEREKLLRLAKKSKGRPNKHLTAEERRQAADLLDKLGHIELAGSVAGTFLPFKPVVRLVTKFLRGRQSDERTRRKEETGSPDREPARKPASAGRKSG